MAVGAFLAVMLLSSLVSEFFYVISYNYTYNNNFETGLSLAGTTLIFVCASLLILAFFCTLATRVKAGTGGKPSCWCGWPCGCCGSWGSSSVGPFGAFVPSRWSPGPHWP